MQIDGPEFEGVSIGLDDQRGFPRRGVAESETTIGLGLHRLAEMVSTDPHQSRCDRMAVDIQDVPGDREAPVQDRHAAPAAQFLGRRARRKPRRVEHAQKLGVREAEFQAADVEVLRDEVNMPSALGIGPGGGVAEIDCFAAAIPPDRLEDRDDDPLDWPPGLVAHDSAD